MLRAISAISLDRAPNSRPPLIAAAVVFIALALAGPSSVSAQEGQLSVDCAGTNGQIVASCQYEEQQVFTVTIHAEQVPAGGYPAFQAKLRWNDTVLSYQPVDDVVDEFVWPSCTVPARRDNRPDDPSVLLGCVANPPEPSSYAGALVQVEFICVAAGTSQLTLVPQAGDSQSGSHFIVLDDGGPGQSIIDPTLTNATVTCGAGGGTVGDADCSGAVTAIDAALILQLIAALTDTLPCENNADTNGDGTVNAVDVTLVLQFTAGLLPSLE